MMRVRRKFAILLSVLVISVFLFLYLVINHSIPQENSPDNLSYIQTKLKQLENGIHRAEVGQIKKPIETKPISERLVDHQVIVEPLELDNKEMVKDSVIKADITFQRDVNSQQQCNLRTDVIPNPDIQMLDIYKSLPFDNPDGGVWKQGWRIEYDEHDWNKHHKLKVFVVPHSHNDPGWLRTFDEYYEHDTKGILTNMLRHLNTHENMKFIWAEISYLSRWFEKLSLDDKKTLKKIVQRKQLEIVTGGWVMADEANSHWLGILQQLTEGQTWVKNNLNITVTASWSIDPFGQSATMPYLLKGARMNNLLIQRTHYAVKKRLAQEKQLEFRWRQLWDTTGDTELFTHMMPFYSYDVPHTCGPDPKICCQFDFKRLPGYGVTCPWRIAPQPIDDGNVAKKAELILDQWRKKSVLYKTRSVLIPLGDDFRYGQSAEWDAQRTNYQQLFDYINNEPNLNTEAKFGTLSDYFESVHKERELVDFPTLSGDFFTYADREDHYWSGYYTSRPFHKRLDRILMNFLRTAEMMYSWTIWDAEAELDIMLEQARRELSLFQHHDGITGTGKDHVVKDYAARMMSALKNCKFVIQQAAYKLLTKPSIYQPDYKFKYFNIDDSRMAGGDENRPIIILGDELPSKHIVLHNSLPYQREELVEFLVSRPFVMVTEFDKSTVECQISPMWSWSKIMYSSTTPQGSSTKYKVMFRAIVPPLGMTVYSIHSTSSVEDSIGTSFAKITILSSTPFSVNIGDYPYQPEFDVPRDISLLSAIDNSGASFNRYGLLKSMSIDENSGTNTPIHLEFFKYGVRQGDERSGAYLFLPDGAATPITLGTPTVLIIKGNLESSVSSGLPFALHETIIRGSGLEIRNLIDIGDLSNTEIIMKLSTGIKSDDIFYTDLNGFQSIKRQRFAKLPLQANYFPVPSSMYIQDETTRLTLITGQPLGGASLKSGEMEIMQDRRLNQDDNRGLGQGVLDNLPTLNIFKLILENRDSCTSKLDTEYPAGFLTEKSSIALQTLLHPMEKLVYYENEWIGALPNFGMDHEPLDKSIQISVQRTLPHIKSTIGLVVHRTHFEECTEREGTINIRKLLGIHDSKEIHNAPITLLVKEDLLQSEEVNLCPMDLKAFIVNR